MQKVNIENISQINPKYWGNSLWKCLNCFALTYQVENKETYKTFFEKVGDLLPCSKCSTHYKSYLSKLDNALDSKEKLLEWLLEIRNDINIKCNKAKLNKDDVLVEVYGDQYWNCNGSSNSNNNNQHAIFEQFIPILILIVLILIFIYMKYSNRI